jgi:hypothetical protein
MDEHTARMINPGDFEPDDYPEKSNYRNEKTVKVSVKIMWRVYAVFPCIWSMRECSKGYCVKGSPINSLSGFFNGRKYMGHYFTTNCRY